MDVWGLLIVGFALWFGFQWGKHSSRNKEVNDEKAERLLKQAELESDPEKKTKMLLEWYQLTEGRRSKKPSFINLFRRKQRQQGKEKPNDS